MYYPDLTPYCYGSEEHYIDPDVLNIGWLDVSHPFPKKKAPESFLDALFERCLDRVCQTRGHHRCPFCRAPSFGVEASRKGARTTLGSAEIRVKGKEGKTYAAPDLIYHYVAEHDYAPPEEFVDAVSR
jgi:hypothetical protein